MAAQRAHQKILPSGVLSSPVAWHLCLLQQFPDSFEHEHDDEHEYDPLVAAHPTVTSVATVR
jgi:hypothetical protein